MVTQQPEKAARRRRFRILALSGGGYLGLYSAAVLAALEEQIGEPIGRRFDLVAGLTAALVTVSVLALAAVARGRDAERRAVENRTSELATEALAAKACTAPRITSAAEL